MVADFSEGKKKNDIAQLCNVTVVFKFSVPESFFFFFQDKD